MKNPVSQMANSRIALLFILLASLSPAASVQSVGEPEWLKLRQDMIRTIERHGRFSADAVGKDGVSPSVLTVMSKVRRHLFVPERRRSTAYADRPVPIGYGQTISQPFIVALMTHLLNVQENDTVLEIGTGSGYQAAVLSPLVRKVCTIEIIPALGESAAKRLKDLGYSNVQTKVADGYHGWPECGPFDAIVVTAVATHVPPPLVQQLKPGGRMVIPVGGAFVTQYLTLVEKSETGQVKTRQLTPVRFVPLTRAKE